MQKIYSLQYLRAFAAIWVLLTHVLQQCEVRPNGVFWVGQCGVDFLPAFRLYHLPYDKREEFVGGF